MSPEHTGVGVGNRQDPEPPGESVGAVGQCLMGIQGCIGSEEGHRSAVCSADRRGSCENVGVWDQEGKKGTQVHRKEM